MGDRVIWNTDPRKGAIVTESAFSIIYDNSRNSRNF